MYCPPYVYFPFPPVFPAPPPPCLFHQCVAPLYETPSPPAPPFGSASCAETVPPRKLASTPPPPEPPEYDVPAAPEPEIVVGLSSEALDVPEPPPPVALIFPVFSR